MSMEVNYSGWQRGEVVYTCDICGSGCKVFEFEDEDIDYGAYQADLKKNGWKTVKINGLWYDFCSDECRNKHMKRIGGY